MDPQDEEQVIPPAPDPVECDDKVGKPEGLFEEVWTILDETYPYFDYKGIDWAAQHDACVKDVCDPAHDYDDFLASGMTCLLAPLRDYHVGVTDRDGMFWGYGTDYATWNIDPGLTDGFLDAGSLVQVNVITGGTLGDARYGYVRVDSFGAGPIDEDLDSVIAGIGIVEGFVIDVRTNGGGNDEYARDLAGHFVTDTTTPFEYVQFREEVDGDPTTHELGPQFARTLDPGYVAAVPFAGPVVLLTGQACASSCESLVAVMDLAPDMRSFGATTLGTSGNPQQVTLDADNETELLSSTWYATLGDGTTVIEWNGIPPDEPVAFTGTDSDEVLDAALAWLDSQ